MDGTNEIYLTLRQAMAVFACTKRCIQQWATTGRIRQVKKGIGRGNESVFAFAPAMMPNGYKQEVTK